MMDHEDRFYVFVFLAIMLFMYLVAHNSGSL